MLTGFLICNALQHKRSDKQFQSKDCATLRQLLTKGTLGTRGFFLVCDEELSG